jgi:hypothetical protein
MLNPSRLTFNIIKKLIFCSIHLIMIPDSDNASAFLIALEKGYPVSFLEFRFHFHLRKLIIDSFKIRNYDSLNDLIELLIIPLLRPFS